MTVTGIHGTPILPVVERPELDDALESFEWNRGKSLFVQGLLTSSLSTPVFAAPELELALHVATFIAPVHPYGVKRVLVRLRNRRYLQYKNQFTLRCARTSGNETEESKVLRGEGDYIFYGFEHPTFGVDPWFIGSFDVFRSVRPKPVAATWNYDNETGFRSYSLETLPSSFIVARSSQWSR